MATTTVVAEFEDTLSSSTYLYVQQIDPGALTNDRLLRDAIETARQPNTREAPVLIRLEGDKSPPGSWQPYMTFVRLDAAPEPCGSVPAVVREADLDQEADRVMVSDWLAAGIRNGYDEELDATIVRTWATDLLNAPSTRSWVATIDGKARGHITVSVGVPDEISGRPCVELTDVMMDGPRAEVASAERQLVAAAAGAAAELNQPFVGNVVHELDTSQERSMRIVDALCRSGWVVTHRVWAEVA